MSRHIWILLVAGALGGATSCATTSTTTRTYTSAAAPSEVGKVGRVDTVREVVTTTEGNPRRGAVAGGLIGGVLFHGSAASVLFGAAAGAATGAAISNAQSSQEIAYEVRVAFPDKTEGVFTYAGAAPFAPGDKVVIGHDGLEPTV